MTTTFSSGESKYLLCAINIFGGGGGGRERERERGIC